MFVVSAGKGRALRADGVVVARAWRQLIQLDFVGCAGGSRGSGLVEGILGSAEADLSVARDGRAPTDGDAIVGAGLQEGPARDVQFGTGEQCFGAPHQ